MSEEGAASTPGRVVLSLGGVRRFLFRILIAVSALGLVAEFGKYANGGIPPDWAQMFSLSHEENLPTWYSTSLILLCGALLAAIAVLVKRGGGGRWSIYWWVLSAIFCFISFDEMIMIHEYSHRLVETGGGLLYFDWVVPAAAVVGIVGLAYIPFLFHLPAATRTQFVVAGCIYVCGAMVLELPLGWWLDNYGDDSLGYGIIDFIEETMEILGMTLFFCALLDYLTVRHKGIPVEG